tara:strand:- start:159 stop:275 length:117 start_codon:yes stop_codon:yes gene_type:complete
MSKVVLLLMLLCLTDCHVKEKAGVCKADAWQSAQLIEE